MFVSKQTNRRLKQMSEKSKLKKGLEDVKKITKKGIVSEFRDFISKGNVMNLAVGVIIGGAFQSIVNSAVNDLIMPFISLFIKGLDFSSWFIALDGNSYLNLESAKNAGVAVINFGKFISATLNFFIMALVIFLLVKILNKLTNPITKKNKKGTEVPVAPVCPYCLMEVKADASRCPHCTSALNDSSIPCTVISEDLND